MPNTPDSKTMKRGLSSINLNAFIDFTNTTLQAPITPLLPKVEAQLPNTKRHISSFPRHTPYRVVVTNTSLSRPENFVKRSENNKGEVTTLLDSEGCWMNSGSGGDSNTLDIFFELRDSSNQRVTVNYAVPVKLKLWTCEHGQIYGTQPLDEITLTTAVDKSGHRRSEHFWLSGRASSELSINLQGVGKVSVKITATSQLHNRKKFSVEVLADPENASSPEAVQTLRNLFSCEKQNSTSENNLSNSIGMSFPIEIMTKINRLQKKRQEFCEFNQARKCLDEAFDKLNTAIVHKNLKPNKEDLTELSQLVSAIQTVLGVEKSTHFSDSKNNSANTYGFDLSKLSDPNLDNFNIRCFTLSPRWESKTYRRIKSAEFLKSLLENKFENEEFEANETQSHDSSGFHDKMDDVFKQEEKETKF